MLAHGACGLSAGRALVRRGACASITGAFARCRAQGAAAALDFALIFAPDPWLAAACPSPWLPTCSLSLGIPRAGPARPDVELTPPPEPLLLQAEIVLQRALPQARPNRRRREKTVAAEAQGTPPLAEAPRAEALAGPSPAPALPTAASGDGATATAALPESGAAPRRHRAAMLPPTGEIEFTVARRAADADRPFGAVVDAGR